ncbi:hypothetical protein WJX72_002299 [[Myrmecia] bisecta]|uniref:N-acetyltransferase domain-containing protein n=1 Tax=[Myrmecia] bisecta TaxID=41462 RepID=A0AAW1P8W2_9CHLO
MFLQRKRVMLRPHRPLAALQASAAGNIGIRQAIQSDLEALYQIEVTCQEAWSYDQLQEEISRDIAIVLVAEGTCGLCGFIVGWHVADEVQVLELAVHPSARRRGIASDLMKALLAHCQRSGRAVSIAILEVSANNGPAIALYTRLGFQTVGRRRGYYSNGDDALLMHRVLLNEAAAPGRLI